MGGQNAIKKTYDNGQTWVDVSGNLQEVAGAGTVARFVVVFTGPPEDQADEGQELMRVGIPVVYFAQKPYYSINCQAAAKYYLYGPNAYGGVCVLASDGMNYVAARAAVDRVELIRVRGGMETVLAETSYAFPERYGWIMLRHIDGHFEVRVKDALAKVWSAPLISYDWYETDGVLLTDPLISHVGVYALLDAPYVRICGYDPDMTPHTGVMPGAHLWDEFPESGVLRIEDARYAYNGIHTAERVLGPYQGRNVGGPYDYENDGAGYHGNAAEFLRFEFLTNGSHHNDFDGEYMATDGGVVWPISDVDYKPWITTQDIRVDLRNRGRFFSAQATGDVIGMQHAVWITHALLSLSQISGEPGGHTKGSIAYLINQSTVRIYEFFAASGYDDLTDRDAIQRMARIANGEAVFPGDITAAGKALSGTPWRVG